MGKRKLCEAKVLGTDVPCGSYPKRGSRWCVSHQDPASRGGSISVADTATVPGLVAAMSSRADVIGGIAGFAADDAGLRSETITVAGSEVEIAHDPESGWRCTATPPAGAAAEDYQQATEAALMGAAAAETLNAAMVDPEHLGLLAAHMNALREGTTCAETVPGVDPVAFEAVAFYALNQVAADMAQRWNDATEAGPAPSRLLPDGFEAHDALRDSEERGYADTCVNKALREVGAGKQVFMEQLPIERIVGSTVSNSPVTAADKTGLGSVVGGDLGVFSDLYEAHTAAGTGAYPLGLVILSKAHRVDPESDEYRHWVREHIKINEEESHSLLDDSKPWAICGVLDAVVYDAPDTELAKRALKVLAEEAPEEFEAGVAEFCSWDLETEEQILAPFADDPALRDVIERAVRSDKHKAPAAPANRQQRISQILSPSSGLPPV